MPKTLPRPTPPAGLDLPLQAGRDRIESVWVQDGIELLRAQFGGRAYARHRHDTYAVCLTDRGLQAFDYRGATRASAPGDVVVLHPDEIHDGRAATDAGFGYRIVYVAPERIARAAQALCGTAVPLPFVAEPVLASPTLARAVAEAFATFPSALEPLAVDSLVEGLARGLLEADRSSRRCRLACDRPAVERTRQFLLANQRRTVTSEELEQVSGHDRYALARQFRRAYGTSPYRYLMMRRLDTARRLILAGEPLAAVAAECGFADQPHLTRLFKATFGLTPAQFRGMAGRTSIRNPDDR